MMLLFDSFPSYTEAERFAAAVRVAYPALEVVVPRTPEESIAADPAGGWSDTPMVFVERPYSGDDTEIEYARQQGFANDAPTGAEIEAEIEDMVSHFAGSFLGT